MNAKIRKLSEIESFYVNLGFNIFYVSEFSGNIPDDFENRLIKEIKRHPLLCAQIKKLDNAYYFFKNLNFKLNLKLIDNDGALTTLNFIQEKIKIPLNVEKALYEFTLIKNRNKFTLILIIHHAIADGMCLLEFHKNILNSEFKPTLPALNPVESYFPSFSQNELDTYVQDYLSKEKTRDTKTLELEHPTNTPNFTFLRHLFNEDDTQKMLLSCKKMDVSMHGYIAAAHLIALKKTLEPETPSSHFHIQSPVNMRPILIPPLSNEAFLVASIGSSLLHSVEKNADIGLLAKECKNKIAEDIETQSIFKRFLTSSRTRPSASGKRIYTALSISNLGQFQSPQTSNFELQDFFFFTTHQIAIPTLLVHTFKNRLSLLYTFNENYFSKTQIQKFAQIARNEMLKKWV